MDEVSRSEIHDHVELTRIIHSNRRIRQIVQETANEFLSLQNDLFQEIQKEEFDETIEQKSKPLLDVLKIQSLNKQVTADKVQLALVGENSCGKTSLIHLLLESDPFLPSDVGSVSARIIHMKYTTNTEACLRVYKSLNKRHQEHLEKVDLSEYFSGGEPNWNGVKAAIEPHVKRPDPEKIEKKSEDFRKWAKKFVEIQIPSNFLKLGIDLYDTPGLLYSDPPILKQNLHDLVKTVRPTVVFMYENASVTVDTKDCYLALKDALGKQLTDISIFFLNTKVDIGTILQNDAEVSDEEFEKTILVNVRKERQELLLKAPSMANEISNGSEFDVISVESEYDPLGVKMNQLTINHLIQFVANSDLKTAHKVSELVLPIINSFFEFAFVTNHRTRAQLQELRRNADQWAENYFINHQNRLDEVLRKLYDVIIKELNDQMDSITRRAEQQGTAKDIEKYIKSVIQHEIINVLVKKFIEPCESFSFIQAFLHSSLLSNPDKNEFLVGAQKSGSDLLSDLLRLLDIGDKMSCELYIYRTIIRPLSFIRDILIETDEEDEQSTTKKNSHGDYLKTILRQDKIRKSTRPTNITNLDIAQQYLNDLRSGLINQKNSLNLILGKWCDHEKDELKEKIDQQYRLAEQFLPQREKAYELANKYAEQFARFECKLIVAQNLASFNGHIPTLNLMEEISIDDNMFFELYSADWLDKKDLIVKKLKITSNLQYLEAHNYRKLSKLDIPNFLPLLYLYQNDDNELWMFFPKYECLENKISTVTIKNVLEIVLAVAKCLERLHANELMHGNVHVKNIYITHDETYLLGDFHYKEMYETITIYVNRHTMSKILWASDNDIYSLGELGMVLYGYLVTNDEIVKILDQFKSLLQQCLSQDPISRPKASKIVEILHDLLKKV